MSEKPARIGKRELDMLAFCATPTGMLLSPSRISDGLVRKGLLRNDASLPGSKAACITPAGLRRLADALEAGDLKDAFELARERREQAN